MTVNELKIDYIYSATFEDDPNPGELMVVCSIHDNTLIGRTLEILDTSESRTESYNWKVDVTKENDYNFKEIGHRDEHPEYLL